MATLSITEALAEIKVIDSRIAKKSELIRQNLFRQEVLRDPFEKEEGGTKGVLTRERQSVKDLFERKLQLRRAIQRTNEAHTATVNGVERTLADWLVWKRDVAPLHKRHLEDTWNAIQNARNDLNRRGSAIITSADLASKPTDFLINIDEMALAKEREELEGILGTLDGQLSLKNAILTFEI